jgi:tetratricopeptide (TPR) repeat protein
MIRFFQFVTVLAAFMASFHARADDVAATFENANKSYNEGKYADAAAAYGKLIAAGRVSEALYFNRGNAFFKMGQLGRAIAAYRQAEFLAPRDRELRGNLQFARTRASGGSPYRADRWTGWMTRLGANEWTILTAALIWVLFILLALGQWRSELNPALRKYMIAAGAAAAAAGICLGIVLSNNVFTQSAIVVAGEADVRNGPLDDSPELYRVRDGAELTIIDEKEGWLQVVDSADRPGWLRRDQVLVFEPPIPSKSKT